MDIYARISFKHYPYINSHARKERGLYRLISINNALVWSKMSLWDRLNGPITHNFYIKAYRQPSYLYIEFEEWHLTKWATRYNKYKEINREKQNEISNRPT